MIKLKIKEAGHIVAIPGLQVFRTPADIDISKLDIRKITMYLKASGVTDYEIVSSISDDKEIPVISKVSTVPKNEPQVKKHTGMERINKIEKMLELLINREASRLSSDKEQINNKLDNLEKLLTNSKGKIQIVDKTPARESIILNEEPDIEEMDSFIPEVDVSDMKFNAGSTKTIKQDSDDLEDAADMLSGLIKK